MKIAAVQMKAKFSKVRDNLQKAESLVKDAFRDGAEWVILPEFFTTAMGFHPDMLRSARSINGKPFQLMKRLARENNGVVGGSFIALWKDIRLNTFILVFPDGSVYLHNKDLPTMWEYCYYLGGNDDGILDTPKGKIGVALCWEFVRSQTANRLYNKVDIVIGGSCWWTLPKKHVPGFPTKIHHENMEIMLNTPSKFAKMLGVHVIHAAHAGNFECKMPLMPFFSYESYYLGETQIVNGAGKILTRMKYEDGEGYVKADINIKEKWNPSHPIPKRFWIPKLSPQIRLIWWYQKYHGMIYYQRKLKSNQ